MIGKEMPVHPENVRVNNFDRFNWLICESGVKGVEGRIKSEKNNGNTIFSIELMSRIPGGGRKIEYKEPYAIRDDKKAKKNAEDVVLVNKKDPRIGEGKVIKTGGIILKGMVTADERLKVVKDISPDVQIIGPTSEMKREVFEKMQEDVMRLRIKPHPEPTTVFNPQKP
ncbi:hypothetical protein KJ980_00210 [Patescibacteria group bacterium]|nr:hypothetical protein [Patescibacteria group bacterium]MBU4098051.1 hypothetical protein [Patescibacteria group bacterium]